MASIDLVQLLKGPKKAQAWNLILANLEEIGQLEQYISMEDLVRYAVNDLGDEALQLHMLTLLLHLSGTAELCSMMLDRNIVSRLQDVDNPSYVTMLLANLTRTERGVASFLQLESEGFKYLLATKLTDNFLSKDPEYEFFSNVLANVSATEIGRTFINYLELAPKLVQELELEGVRHQGLLKCIRNLIMSSEGSWQGDLVDRLCLLLKAKHQPLPITHTSEDLLDLEGLTDGDDLCDTLVYLARTAPHLERMRAHDLTTIVFHLLQRLDPPALQHWALLYQVLASALIV